MRPRSKLLRGKAFSLILRTGAKDPFFTPFGPGPELPFLLAGLPIPSKLELHPLCLSAARQLQDYLNTQVDFEHNFGLTGQQNSMVVGKMFGVLLVKTADDDLGYLSAFSGKLAGRNHHSRFVPPVFDALGKGSFLNEGMSELKTLSLEIENEELSKPEPNKKLQQLRTARREYSHRLQRKLFDHYHFINQSGEQRSLNEIFTDASYKNPPAGAGECAAPKLLQYAFKQNMKPLALAEFWWGQSPKSNHWKHGEFYPCCKEKCGPILKFMLEERIYQYL